MTANLNRDEAPLAFSLLRTPPLAGMIGCASVASVQALAHW